MIQILPVHREIDAALTSDFFQGKEHFYTMEMQDGPVTMGLGTIFIKGDVAYLMTLEINDASAQYMIADSLIRSLMNLATHHGALIFNANESIPLMNYFTKHAFDRTDNFTLLEDESHYQFYVGIEGFFSRPCKG